MDDLQYPACLRAFYESEIFGEASALALLAAAEDDRDRYHFGTLLQLETETKARIRPLLFRHGIELSEDMELGDIEGMVADYREHGFGKFLGDSIPIVEKFLTVFQQIERICPPEDRAIAESMVRHESSIRRWMQMESDGETEGSLDDIISQLQYPLPRPESP